MHTYNFTAKESRESLQDCIGTSSFNLSADYNVYIIFFQFLLNIFDQVPSLWKCLTFSWVAAYTQNITDYFEHTGHFPYCILFCFRVYNCMSTIGCGKHSLWIIILHTLKGVATFQDSVA